MCAKANIVLVAVDADLDVRSVPALRRSLDRLIASGCRRIVLNMAGAAYVDSAGMGLILTELRRMRSVGGLLSLVNVSPLVYRALARMRMLDVMPVSRADVRREVSSLDPSALPLWRTTLRVDPEALSGARGEVSGLLGRSRLSSDEVFDMTLATGEALGNAFDHTCGDGVLVTVEAFDDRVRVDVADCGEGFELAAGDEPPEVGEFAERGRGIKLMRLLADAVSIEPKSSGEGTVVRLVKLYDAAEPTAALV